MLHSIQSSLPRFKSLEFRPGLNIVLADRAATSGDRQSRNGAGKTSLIETIHFLLGSNADKDSIFRNAALVDATFTGVIDLTDRAVTASRNGRTPSKIRFEIDTFSDWPIRPSRDKKTGESTLSNGSWRALLGALMFGLPSLDEDDDATAGAPTFRSLFAYFVRRQRAGAFTSPEKQAEMQQLGDQQIALSYLLGLDWTIAQQWEQVRIREKSLRELKRAMSQGALGSVVGSSAEIRSQLTIAQEAVRRLRESLSTYFVVPEYADIEREASGLTTQLSDLADYNTGDRQLLTELRRSLENERAPQRVDLDRVYGEVGIVLPDLVTKRYDEVQAFHESVLRNRRNYLESEIKLAEQRIGTRTAEMGTLDERRGTLMMTLRAGGALEHFSRLQSELTRREAEAEALRQRFRAAQQLESERTELEIERNQLLTRLRQDYAEQGDVLDRAILRFEEVSEALYEKAGKLQIEPTLNGPRFSVTIEGSLSKGISNMQIFCFDMMLMQICAERRIGPGFLVHDSHLFDGVDSRQIAKALQIGSSLAEQYGFQYIVTLNSDLLQNGVIAGVDVTSHTLSHRLLDDGSDGGLFGLRFD